MNRLLFLLILFLLVGNTVGIQAQTPPEAVQMQSRDTRWGIGVAEIHDSYLSGLNYTGLNLQYNSEVAAFLSKERTDLVYWYRSNARFGLLFNPAGTSMMQSYRYEEALGLNYRGGFLENTGIQAGLFADAGIGAKYIARNVNNPFNLDAYTNLNISAGGSVPYDLFGKLVYLDWKLQMPLAGLMFVPENGASYYEMFSFENQQHMIHFASLHNQIGLKADLSARFTFLKHDMTLGYRSETLRYSANQLNFYDKSYQIYFGLNLEELRIKGSNGELPQGYVSPRNY
jgi:hypothetical protein